MSERAQAARQLAALGREIQARGWAFATSGNFSAVLGRNPLRLAISASGLDKGRMQPSQVVEVDARGRRLRGQGSPSAETLLHLAVVGTLEAGAVLHTHSVWSTLLSERFAAAGEIVFENLEMLKGLAGVFSHRHRERLPILANSQDIAQLARKVEKLLRRHPSLHGFLLRGHGLYTWGEDLSQAKRHLEAWEFLLELEGRKIAVPAAQPRSRRGSHGARTRARA